MSHNFNAQTSGLVTISMILPGNGWFSCKYNRTYCNFANFDSCSIVQSENGSVFVYRKASFILQMVNFLIVWPHTPGYKHPLPVYICVTRTNNDICECDVFHQKFMAHSLYLIVNSLSLFCTKSYFFSTQFNVSI